MFLCTYIVLVGVLINNYCIAERRIRNGVELSKELATKSYMVYLIKTPVSTKKYDHWLCGGALVTQEHIVTSAACVEDVKHMYAIASYGKYAADIKKDECTNKIKKKVIMTCVPKEYKLNYAKIEKWALIDIAVVKVESPYPVTSKDNECGNPKPIAINYEPKYQEPGVDTVVYGFGSKEKWRKEEETKNNNAKSLRYASLLILDKTTCKKHYKKDKPLLNIIDKYMICTISGGNLDSEGNIIRPADKIDGCTYPKILRAGRCVVPMSSRRESENFNDSNETSALTNDTLDKYPTRRVDTSICQNDHGGPLITWVGAKAVLIGVASVFRINKKWQCEGPNLFTSTQCNGKFLDCVLNADSESTPGSSTTEDSISDTNKDETRRRLFPGSCENPAEMGFNIIRKHISWVDHPDGPAENELAGIRERPQIPIQEA